MPSFPNNYFNNFLLSLDFQSPVAKVIWGYFVSENILTSLAFTKPINILNGIYIIASSVKLLTTFGLNFLKN